MKSEERQSVTPATARTPRELARLPRAQALFYGVILRLVELTGAWRYPIRASGDYESMKLRDILYWLHKAKHHVLPVRNVVLICVRTSRHNGPSDGRFPKTLRRNRSSRFRLSATS